MTSKHCFLSSEYPCYQELSNIKVEFTLSRSLCFPFSNIGCHIETVGCCAPAEDRPIPMQHIAILPNRYKASLPSLVTTRYEWIFAGSHWVEPFLQVFLEQVS